MIYFIRFVEKKILKQNHDNSNTNHCEFKKLLKTIYKKYY